MNYSDNRCNVCAYYSFLGPGQHRCNAPVPQWVAEFAAEPRPTPDVAPLFGDKCALFVRGNAMPMASEP